MPFNNVKSTEYNLDIYSQYPSYTIPVVMIATNDKWNDKLIDYLTKPSKSSRKIAYVPVDVITAYLLTLHIDNVYDGIEHACFINDSILAEFIVSTGEIRKKTSSFEPYSNIINKTGFKSAQKNISFPLALPAVLQINTCSAETQVIFQLLATNHIIMREIVKIIDDFNREGFISSVWTSTTKPYPTFSLILELLLRLRYGRSRNFGLGKNMLPLLKVLEGQQPPTLSAGIDEIFELMMPELNSFLSTPENFAKCNPIVKRLFTSYFTLTHKFHCSCSNEQICNKMSDSDCFRWTMAVDTETVNIVQYLTSKVKSMHRTLFFCEKCNRPCQGDNVVIERASMSTFLLLDVTYALKPTKC